MNLEPSSPERWIDSSISITAWLAPPCNGPHSAQTPAAALANRFARLDATWGLATTGVAGPDRQEGRAVGTVWVAVVGPAGATARLEGVVNVKAVPPAQVKHWEEEGATFAKKLPDGSAREVQIIATGVELTR